MSANKTRKPIVMTNSGHKEAASNHLEELILSFLESIEIERALSHYTVRNYHFYLRRFAAWFSDATGSNDVGKLSLPVVRKYRVYLSRYSDKKGRTLSRVTQSYYVIALRSFLKWLVKNDYDVLPPDKIDLPKGESRSLIFLSRTQVERLMDQPSLSKPQGMRDKVILEMLFSTGMRVSELVGLNRDQVDLERREFGIIGKGGRARVVFLSKRAADWVARYLASRTDHWRPLFTRFSRGAQDPQSDGEAMRLTSRTVQRIVEKYRKKAGLAQRVTPHGLRHSFATDLLHAGAGLREVQEMLGHKNIATTQIYTHVTNPQLRRVHEEFHGKS